MTNVVELKANEKTMDQEQVKLLLSEHLQQLRRYAYSLTQDVNDADDLLQNVIERILKKSVPVDVKFLAWVFRICRNAWIDELRSRNIRQPSGDVEELDIEDVSHRFRPNENILKVDLQKAMNELSTPFKEVINLVIVAGFSYAEASETLDLPIGTIMSRVARARKQLAIKLCVDNE